MSFSDHLGLLAAVGVLLALPALFAAQSAPVSPDGKPAAGEIPARSEPVLKETARDLKLDVWINPDLPENEKPELLWVKTVWGMNGENLYKNWEKKQPWGNAEHWYLTWTDIIRYKGKLVVGFQELNETHAYGDSVQHIIVSADDGATWQSAVHYEVESRDPRDKAPAQGRTEQRRTAGFLNGYFAVTPDGRLMMSGRAGNGGIGFWQATAFSHDASTWTNLRKWTWEGIDPATADKRMETFRPAWGPDGRLYGGTRGGPFWRTKDADGLVWEKIEVKEPADGRPADNETATAFVKDRCFLFLRSGQVSSARPPYTHWEINKETAEGPNSHGGPNAKALPNGELLCSSRWRRGDQQNLATIFKYDGEKLIPILTAPSGSTATAYPGMTWEDGFLWMSFMSHNPDGKTPEEVKRGLVTVAKFKWPLKPGARSVADVYDQRAVTQPAK